MNPLKGQRVFCTVIQIKILFAFLIVKLQYMAINNFFIKNDNILFDNINIFDIYCF